MRKQNVKRLALLVLLFCAGINSRAVVNPTEELDLAHSPHFCGEPLPLHKKKVLQQYSKALHHGLVRSLPQLRLTAQKHFKIIEPILKKHQIPNDFKYLCLIESTFEAKATSHRGASGYWQFMPETAREMGLSVNKKVDERHHLVKSTHAACRYFKQLYDQLGAWTLVAAAYNAGIQRVNQYMRKTQSMDYYDWRTNPETAQYVYRVVAVKEWFTAPERFRYWASVYTPATPQKSPKKLKEMLVEVEVVEAQLDDESELDDEALGLNLPVINEAKSVQENSPITAATPTPAPLGISSVLVNTAMPQKGQTWVFEITDAKTLQNINLVAGDRLYAEVEAVNVQAGTVQLKCIQLYSPSRHQMFQLSLITTQPSEIKPQARVFWELR